MLRTLARRATDAWHILIGRATLQPATFDPAIFQGLLGQARSGGVSDAKAMRRLQARVDYLEGRNRLGLERYRALKTECYQLKRRIAELTGETHDFEDYPSCESGGAGSAVGS